MVKRVNSTQEAGIKTFELLHVGNSDGNQDVEANGHGQDGNSF